MSELTTIDKMEALLKYKSVKQWLSDAQDSTKKKYLYYILKFSEYHNINLENFLEEAKRDKIEAKTKVNEYYKHLRDNGAAYTYAATFDATIKSFLSYHEVKIKTKQRKTPRKHHRKALRKGAIKKIIEAATHLRDKALILLAFQTGMSISDLLKLNYSDIKDTVASNVMFPSYLKGVGMIRYIRGKAGVESLAMYGQDSITLLQKYINWRTQTGEMITDEAPLFIAIRKKQGDRLSKRSSQRLMRDALIKAGITTFEELKKSKTVNPYGFHAIRKAFSSIAEQYGMPKSQIDQSMGHTLPYNGAYVEFTEKERIDNYKKVEPYLSIYSDHEELEEKQKETKATLEILTQENQALREQLQELMRALKHKNII